MDIDKWLDEVSEVERKQAEARVRKTPEDDIDAMLEGFARVYQKELEFDVEFGPPSESEDGEPQPKARAVLAREQVVCAGCHRVSWLRLPKDGPKLRKAYFLCHGAGEYEGPYCFECATARRDKELSAFGDFADAFMISVEVNKTVFSAIYVYMSQGNQTDVVDEGEIMANADTDTDDVELLF